MNTLMLFVATGYTGVSRLRNPGACPGNAGAFYFNLATKSQRESQ